MHDQGSLPEIKYDILSPAFFADPYPTLDRMRAEDPVYWHPLLRSWVLTRYADVTKVVRDTGGKFTAARVEQYGAGAPEHVRDKLKVCNEFIGRWISFMDPPEHTRLRALIAKSFTAQAVERLRPRIEAIVEQLLAGARERREIEVVAEFAGPLPRLVFAELLGIPAEDSDDLRRHGDAIVMLLGAGLVSAEVVEAAHVGTLYFYEYFQKHIAEKRQHATPDLLSKLIEARVDGVGMTDDELVAMCVILMLANDETTTKLITNGVLALIRHPDAAREIRNDPSLIDNTVDEVMRYDSPTFGTFRRAVVDNDELGVRIASGDFVLGLLTAANRDPARFPEPEKFDIHRSDTRHLSFSSGIHICPGAATARLEARVALTALLRICSEMELATDTLEYPFHMMVRGPKSLPIRLR
ncbi:MAG: cytochrome P450 [Myxococcales bacterium]|nr:cytochrome P450 [Myxococcales bacterium]